MGFHPAGVDTIFEVPSSDVRIRVSRRTRADRELLAAKRLRNVLRVHGVATDRTLEQKISDAGPFDQRIDPHVLTDVRRLWWTKVRSS